MTNEGKALLVDAGEPHWPMSQRSGAGTNWRRSRAPTVFALCTTSVKERLTARARDSRITVEAPDWADPPVLCQEGPYRA